MAKARLGELNGNIKPKRKTLRTEFAISKVQLREPTVELTS